MTQPLGEFPPDAAQFLKTFYGPGNQMKLEPLWHNSRPEAQCQKAFIQRLIRPAYQFTVLFRRTLDGRRVWYAFADDDRTYRALRESLLAFVGPSYSDFHGQAMRLDLNDEIDAAVSTFTGGRVYKFQMPRTVTEPGPIWQALQLMLHIWTAAPSGNQTLTRPTGRLLRDFEVALATRQYADAADLLSTLRAEGRLDASNLAFLEIRLHLEQGQWSLLLNDHRPLLDSVLAMRRPLRLTQSLIQALYRSEFSAFETAGNVAGAVKHFRQWALPEFAPLFSALGEMNAPEALKAFLLFAATEGAAPQAWLERASSVLQGDSFGQALLDVISAPPQVSSQAALEAAQTALMAHQYDRAFELALPAPEGEQRAALLLQAAYEIRSLQAAQIVRTAVAALSEAQRAHLFQSHISRILYEGLLGSSQSNTVHGWVAWLNRLTNIGSWPTAVEEAAAGVLEWPLGQNDFQVLASAIRTSRSPGDQALFYEALPHLLASINAPSVTQRDRVSLYQPILETLVLDDALSATDLPLIQELSEAILAEQPQVGTYEELLGYYLYLWNLFGSVTHLDWILDVVDSLVALPCPDPEARLRVLIEVVGTFKSSPRRISPRQWMHFELLCGDLQLPDMWSSIQVQRNQAPPPEPSDLPREGLDGKTIGVYTLTERAGRNFVQLAEALYPGVRVDVQVAYVATTRLRELARHADIFLMVTSSATHAATAAITSERPANMVTLYPAGKGVSSMLACLQAYLETL